MSFTQSIRSCFAKYVTFSGRATRAEFWWFTLFLFLGNIVATILDGILFRGSVVTSSHSFAARADGPLAGLFGIATFLPALAAGWRRMHDTGRSGLYVLFPLLVIVAMACLTLFLSFGMGPLGLLATPFLLLGWLLLIASPLLMLWWLTRPSQPNDNQWGPVPFPVGNDTADMTGGAA